MNKKQELGKLGENRAVEHLKSIGYKVLERNWRWLKAEIDIIALNREELVFVEVKTRENNQFGEPEEFVSEKQQKMIINAAHQYITSKDLDQEARFDIVAITQNPFNLHHIQEAFNPF